MLIILIIVEHGTNYIIYLDVININENIKSISSIYCLIHILLFSILF